MFKVGNLLGIAGDTADQIGNIVDGNYYCASHFRNERTDGRHQRFLALAVQILVVLHRVDDGDHQNEIVGIVAEVGCHIAEGKNPAFQSGVGGRHQHPDQQHSAITCCGDKQHLLHEFFAGGFAGKHRINHHQNSCRCQTESGEIGIKPAFVSKIEIDEGRSHSADREIISDLLEEEDHSDPDQLIIAFENVNDFFETERSRRLGADFTPLPNTEDREAEESRGKNADDQSNTAIGIGSVSAER